jgi:hypothetical protein
VRAVSICWISVAATTLSVHGFIADLPIIGAIAALIGALWVSRSLRADRRRAGTPFLTIFAGLSCLSATQGNWLLPAVSLSAALYGWDAAVSSAHLTTFPRSTIERFAARYTAWALLLAAAGILAGTIAVRLRLQLSFPVALALATSALLLTLGVLRCVRTRSSRSSTERA